MPSSGTLHWPQTFWRFSRSYSSCFGSRSSVLWRKRPFSTFSVENEAFWFPSRWVNSPVRRILNRPPNFHAHSEGLLYLYVGQSWPSDETFVRHLEDAKSSKDLNPCAGRLRYYYNSVKKVRGYNYLWTEVIFYYAALISVAATMKHRVEIKST